ncbi:MAG: protein jag [Anaerolineales bacterium]|nr:protein jag [Anaerolineales bacterium]
MTEQQILETSGETVEDAVQQGLAILGLKRDEVNIEVLDEGRGGFLGLGHRDASVRLTVLAPGQEKQADAIVSTPEPPKLEPTPEPVVITPVQDEIVLDELEDLPDPELLEEEETAHYLVSKLIEKLDLEASVESALSEKDDRGRQVVLLTIEGDELGDLIGRRGDTLNSLQYLSRLMASQQLRRRVEFQIDVNGYREQREEGLKRMAERMADKVVRRGRTVTLEPMSPYERRLIHVHLRDNNAVTTSSIGQGSGRRVQIHVAGQEEKTENSGNNNRNQRRSNRSRRRS